MDIVSFSTLFISFLTHFLIFPHGFLAILLNLEFNSTSKNLKVYGKISKLHSNANFTRSPFFEVEWNSTFLRVYHISPLDMHFVLRFFEVELNSSFLGVLEKSPHKSNKNISKILNSPLYFAFFFLFYFFFQNSKNLK